MKVLLFGWGLLSPILLIAQEYSYRTVEFNVQDENNLKFFTHKNLRLYPVKAKEALKEQTRQFANYTPLKQAMDKKKVRIMEKEGSGEGSDVNSLYIQNTSSDTVYIMAGEVIQGGKQDRVIGQDMVLPPNSAKKKLSVYCVEHGRWSSNGSANDFNKYYSVSGMSVRKAVDVEKNQGKVWEKVAEGNQKNKVSTTTGAYTALASSSNYQKVEKEYLDFLLPRLKSTEGLVGVIVVTGDKVIGCELFATESLFKDAAENLLKSYIHEAVTNGRPVNISPVTVKNYMDDILVNQADQEKKVNKKGKIFSANGKKLHLTTYD